MLGDDLSVTAGRDGRRLEGYRFEGDRPGSETGFAERAPSRFRSLGGAREFLSPAEPAPGLVGQERVQEVAGGVGVPGGPAGVGPRVQVNGGGGV